MITSNKSPKSPLVLLALIAILVIATLVVVSSYFLRPSIELELKKDVLKHFENVGLSKSLVKISGRDVILSGEVLNLTEALKAENTAKEIWGIREVNNQLLIKNQPVE